MVDEISVKGSNTVAQMGTLRTDAINAIRPYLAGFLASITSIRWYTDDISSDDSYLNS